MDEENIGTVSLENYEVIRKEAFESQDTWICFAPRDDGRILFSESCISFLGKPPYVQIFMNSDVKRLILRGLQKKREGKRNGLNTAIKVSYEGERAEVQGFCGILIRKLMEVMDWDPSMRYQIAGQKLTTESKNLLSFSLDMAIAKSTAVEHDDDIQPAESQ